VFGVISSSWQSGVAYEPLENSFKPAPGFPIGQIQDGYAGGGSFGDGVVGGDLGERYLPT
jgi:hypothetical protein